MAAGETKMSKKSAEELSSCSLSFVSKNISKISEQISRVGKLEASLVIISLVAYLLDAITGELAG
jgi:DNA polymerase III sliding clamp (beta) subunit (PCNA family)